VFGFGKRNKQSYPATSKWAVLEGTNSGKVMFVRRNDAARGLSKHPEYHFRVGVALPLKAPNEHGLPGAAESEELNAIEDMLVPRLESEQRSLLVLTITTGGMREFVFYTRDRQFAQSVLEELRTEVSSHELQAYIEDDPGWQAYNQFA